MGAIQPSQWDRVDASYVDKTGTSTYSFEWHVNPIHRDFVVRTVDLIIKPLPPLSPEQQSINATTFTWPQKLHQGFGTNNLNIKEFIESSISRGNLEASIKLIVPAKNGYVTQSNIMEVRLHGFPGCDKASGFMQPGELVKSFSPKIGSNSISQLYELLSNSIGAISITSNTIPLYHALETAELEFRNRLSLPFLLPDPIPRQRLGLAGCLDTPMFYETVRCLGIDLIVFEGFGHFMEDPKGPCGHLRTSFHGMDMNPDDDFVSRLYEKVKDKKLDGIATRFDVLHAKVAEVAQMLDLPTSTPEAFLTGTNKFKARAAQKEKNLSIQIKGSEELEKLLHDPEHPLSIEYPVVVKPCEGRSSFCVVKASTEAELLAATKKASTLILGAGGSLNLHPDVIIEPYISGPEVDINMALWDGEVVFYDISDNAPTPGDLDEVGTSGTKDFQEGLFMYPSILPDAEQDMICQEMKNCILNMGFRYGVFHCEARVRNSAMHYVQRSDGIVDLEKVQEQTGEASMFMIEVNCRPPGYWGLYAVTWTHGVDLWGLHVFRSLNDERRFRALSTPFANGPQHASAVLLVMPEKGGILRSGDPAVRLEKEKPELRKSISLYKNFFEPGQYVTPPDAVSTKFIGIIVVETKEGREDLMQKVEELKVEWTPLIE